MANIQTRNTGVFIGKRNIRTVIVKDFIKNKFVYMMAVPMLLYYILFHYQPMYGAIIAFKNFSPGRGIIDSPWAGLYHFKSFFEGAFFWRIFRNTFLINIYDIIFGFPAPIILALLINEIRKIFFKRLVQTVTYLPHFISLMVICGMIIDFTSSNGIINDIIELLGGERRTLLLKPELFRTIYISTNIWQSVGWGSIIYLSALTGIDPQLYEASIIDGAGRWRQTISITIPGILPTIIIMLILRLGRMMDVGFEKVILLYNPSTYETADVISSFVYRKGLLEFNYSFSAAVGLFNSIINFSMLVTANWISRKANETSLW